MRETRIRLCLRPPADRQTLSKVLGRTLLKCSRTFLFLNIFLSQFGEPRTDLADIPALLEGYFVLFYFVRAQTGLCACNLLRMHADLCICRRRLTTSVSILHAHLCAAWLFIYFFLLICDSAGSDERIKRVAAAQMPKCHSA